MQGFGRVHDIGLVGFAGFVGLWSLFEHIWTLNALHTPYTLPWTLSPKPQTPNPKP